MRTGGFTGESIREYFSSDDFEDVVEVVYTPMGGAPVTTDVFFAEKSAISPDQTVRLTFIEVIVGRDHVAEPGAGDTLEYLGHTYAAQELLELDGETAMLRFE